MLENLTPEDLVKAQILAKSDPLFLAQLKFPDMDWNNWHLKVMVETVLNEPRALLILPRFSGKSTLTGTILPAWLIGRDPVDESVALVTHTQRYSEDFVRAVRDLIDYNMDYRLAFGQLDTTKSDQTQVVLKQKLEKKIPSLEGLGVGCATVGRHPNRWFIDDVIDRKKANSDTQTRNIKEWFKYELLPCARGAQQIVVVGTRWRFNDLYGDLIKGGEFKVIHVEAIGTDRTELGRTYLNQSYWPKIWSLEALLKKKQEVGIYAWQSQYQNDPSLEEGTIFRAEWIQHFDQLPNAHLEILQGVDLAISEKSTADYFVIATVGFERQTGSIYLLDLFRDHITFLEQQNKIKEYARKWSPQSIAIEETAYQKAMIQTLESTYLPVVGIKQTHDKTMRMQALTPHFENRKVWIRRGMEDFETELLQFPRGDHDDTLDAFEMAVGCIRTYDTSVLFNIVGAKRPQ